MPNLLPGALPERPRGGRDARYGADFAAQRLAGAGNVAEVLELMEQQQRSSIAVPMPVDLAALQSLARLLKPPETLSISPNRAPRLSDDLKLRLQNAVRRTLRDLHSKRSLMPLQMVTELLASLWVVLPALGWQLADPRVILDIAARMVPAAVDAERMNPVSLEQLCSALRALARLATYPLDPQSPVMRDARSYLLPGVVGGERMAPRLAAADMAALAEAVQLVVEYDIEPPEAFVQASVQRVDQLLAVAVRQDGGGDGAGAGGAGRDSTAAASSAPAGGGRGQAGRRRDRQDSAPTEQVAAAPAQAESDLPELDVAALVRLLTAWFGVQPGRRRPDDAWLARYAALVLRSLDPVAVSRPSALRKELAELQSQLCSLNEQLDVLLMEHVHKQQKQEGATGGMAEDAGASSRARGGGRGQRGRGQGRGSRGVASSSSAAAEASAPAGAAAAGRAGQRQRRRFSASEAMAAVRSMEPRAAKAVSEILKAATGTQAQLGRVREDLASLDAGGLLTLVRPRGPVSDEDVAELLTAMAAQAQQLGDDDAGRELGGLAGTAVAARIKDLEGRLVVQALAALAKMGHKPAPAMTAEALRTCFRKTSTGRRQYSLSHAQVLQLLGALEEFGYVPPDPRAVLDSVEQDVVSSGGLSAAPTELVRLLVRTHGSWGVGISSEAYESLRDVVESRVLLALPAAEVRELPTRLQVLRVSKANEGGGAGMSLQQLLEDVLLPLARLRQGFSRPEMFTLALGDWARRGFEGLEERKVTALLNTYAYNPSWPAVPQLREAVYELLVRALLMPLTSPEGLSKMIMAGSRALRIMADKMQRPAGTPVLDVTDPRVAVLILPAVERLLQLEPTAHRVAGAAHALFVELQWRGPSSSSVPKATEAGKGISQAAAAEAVQTQGQTQVQAEALLSRMLGVAEPSLRGCSLEGYTYLLAACNALQHRPPDAWLESLYRAVTQGLHRKGVTQDQLGSLLDGVSRLERLRQGVTAGGEGAGVVQARGPLLDAMAQAMLSVTYSEPDTLALAGRKLAVLGLQADQEWLERYMQHFAGDLSRWSSSRSLSLTGLANLVDGLVLLRAVPQPSFLEGLMLYASKDLKNLSTYDPYLYGMLLGGAHGLRQNGLRRAAQIQRRARWQQRSAGQHGQQQLAQALARRLSTEAMDAWARVHVQLLSETRKGTRVQLFQSHQLILLVSAVASYELAKAAITSSSSKGASSGGGGGSSNSSSSSRGRAAAAADMARVSLQWLQDFVGALLYNLSKNLQSTSAFLPPPAMLVDLLRLTSCVLYSSRDGGIQGLVPTAAEAGQPEGIVKALVVKYVSRSMLLLAGARTGAGGAAAAARDSSIISVDEWFELLRAAMAAGIKPGVKELSAYTAALVSAVAGPAEVPPAVAASEDGSLKAAPAAAAEGAQRGKKKPGKKQRWQQQPQQLRAAWSDLESGLQEVLLPALPCIPDPQWWGQLQKGLLSSSAALAQASWRQLGLLCSYAAQVGPDLAPASWWQQRLWAEVQRRLTIASRASSTVETPDPDEPSSKAVTPAWNHPSIMEVASVCYGLEVNGCGIPKAAQTLLLQGLEALAGAADVQDGSSAGELEAVELLPSLHLLWVARQGGFLGTVPSRAWSAAYGGLGPSSTALSSLLPQQLAQLVLLRADWVQLVSTAGNNTGGSRLAPVLEVPDCYKTVWLEGLILAYNKSQREHSGFEGASVHPLQLPLEPLVAALAVCHCLPSAGGNRQDSSWAQGSVAVLVDHALPALASALPLVELPAFLAALEERALPLQQPYLQAVVNRLAGPATAGGLPAPAPAAIGVAQATTPAAADSQLALLAPDQAVRVVTALLSPKEVGAVLPVLSALMPHAVNDVVNGALAERLGDLVLASGLAAALHTANACEVLTRQTGRSVPVPGQAVFVITGTAVDAAAQTAGATCAAWVCSAATASMVETLLQQPPLSPSLPQQQWPPQQQQQHQPGQQQHESSQQLISARVSLEILPPGKLANLAVALIEAAGPHMLPLPAAAVLLRLLSVEAVVPLVPVTLLERALRHSLAGTGLPLPDTAYQLLFTRLQTLVELPSLISSLQRCGARDVQLHRVLLGLRDLRGLSVASILGVLQLLVNSGVREQLARVRWPKVEPPSANEDEDDVRRGTTVAHVKVDPVAANDAKRQTAASGKPDGPYALLVVRLLWRLVRLTKTEEVGLRQAAEAMRLVVVLRERLEGIWCFNFFMGVAQILNSSLLYRDRWALKEMAEDSGVLFDFLEAAHALGGAYFTEMSYITTKRHIASLDVLGEHCSFTPAWNTETEVMMEQARGLNSFTSAFGPYLLSGYSNAVLVRGITPLIQENKALLVADLKAAAAVQLEGAPQQGQPLQMLLQQTVEALMGERDGLPPVLLGAGPAEQATELLALLATSRPQNPRLLSVRQLGQLYGVLGLTATQLPEVEEARDELLKMYIIELVSVAHRQYKGTTNPLEHLIAVLDALEPIVVADPTHHLHEEKFYSAQIPVAAVLVEPLRRVLMVDQTPLPEGAEVAADTARMMSPYPLSEESLLAGLFLPQGDVVKEQLLTAASAPPDPHTVKGAQLLYGLSYVNRLVSGPDRQQQQQAAGAAARMGPARVRVREQNLTAPPSTDTSVAVVLAVWASLQLPTALKPPPGRRHGQPGDPEGDAAREAYVRSVAPWLVASRRLELSLYFTDQAKAVRARLQECGVSEPVGKGRWASLLGALIFKNTDATNKMRVAQQQGSFQEAQVAAAAAAAAAAAEVRAAALERAMAAVPTWASVMPGTPDLSNFLKLMQVTANFTELLQQHSSSSSGSSGGSGASSGGGGGQSPGMVGLEVSWERGFSEREMRVLHGEVGDEDGDEDEDEDSTANNEGQQVKGERWDKGPGKQQVQGDAQLPAAGTGGSSVQQQDRGVAPATAATSIPADAPVPLPPPPSPSPDAATSSLSSSSGHLNPFSVTADFMRKMMDMGFSVGNKGDDKGKRPAGGGSSSAPP